MLQTLKTAALAAVLLGSAASAGLAANPMVGGAAMFETRNIVENAVNSKDHTTLVAAVQAAGLVDTLAGPGPFTVFAPTNAAFADLPDGTVDTLLMPENKGMLTGVLTYHVVAGRLTAEDLAARIAAGDGVYIFETVNGTKISAQMRGDTIYIGDKSGNNATITISDVNQSNGVIHVLDRVLLPM
ncbi:MAG: fasciclin domain-containing protein [Rhodobacteraceae bacterium]|nr:fasciclin domain-containing protein [Paracoccaceae bacterium]